MLLNAHGAADNIIFSPKERCSAEVLMDNSGKGAITVKWEIYPEDWYKKNNTNNIIKPKQVLGTILSASDLKVNIQTPQLPGPYRLFAAIYDSYGHVATCNTPFYVMAK